MPNIKGKSEIERRRQQAKRDARIVVLSRLIDAHGEGPGVTEVRKFAKTLGVNERTVYRDIGVIKEAQKIISGL